MESIYNKDGSITSEFYPKARSRFRRALGTAFHLYRYARGGNLLDVGCGGGFQVAAFRWFGIEASGLDISADSIGYAKNNFKKSNFYCSNFENFSINKKFNFIFSSEVIEHVVDLNGYMDFLNKCLSSKGYVYITTPDIASIRVPANIVDWDVFSPPRHVQFFCRDNIVALFEQHGFALEKQFRDPKAGLRVLFRKI
ncbi:MAG: class I SAM-dependent methyltransferase [Pseudomonadota bacterium]|nr:class I SAM-dependent methyltransferase [Pseudomonadota bacterium]